MNGSMSRRDVSTILIVDDDHAIRRLVKDCLERAGYAVLAAADGLEAVAVFKQHRLNIALVITDVAMPNMNGLDLADSVFEMESRVPVLFMSGDAISTGRARGCLAKPFTSARLLDRVRHALDSTDRGIVSPVSL